MFTSAEKTNRSTTTVQQKAQQQTFFRKAGEESFFGNKEQSSFFSAPIQAKLSVSSPDDPQEKEADAVADQVMRMPDPVSSVAAGNEQQIDKKEEEEKVAPKIEAPVISRKISCKEEGENIQSKQLTAIFRMPGENDDRSFSDASSAGPSNSAYINCKQTGLYHSDIIQRSGRGPPMGSIPFEQSLSSSKGGGSALPGDTRHFMESRFNADFSGVRIHTGATAQTMSSSIHAQAFAHGNDIYFNEGKFSPNTQSGATLLAHELTHTIQQGASPAKAASTVSPKSIARKNIIQRSGGGVPVQLTNAVEKAKTVEGKIDANKPQADGFRTGWEHLLEIFKTTFGEDMVVGGAGGTSVKGAVAEQDIKKKRETTGMIVDKNTVTDKQSIPKTTTGTRDAMPSWCGIFTFWALNKSGVPMPKWKLGERMIKPESARPPGMLPMPGDIAYRNAYSHYAIVESAAGNTVKTVNGNTAGEDNLGGQVQTIEAPLTDWTAFFNPLLIMTGSLGTGDGAAVEEKPKTLKELRKELFHVNRKEENDQDDSPGNNDIPVQAKPELSNWSVNGDGAIHQNNIQQKTEPEELQKKEEGQPEEEKTVAPKLFALQRKNCSECDVDKNELSQSASSVSVATIQNKELDHIDNSSSSQHDIIARSAAVQDRGPPVNLRNSGNVIQCGWFDDALSFVDSAIDFVAEGLEAGKRLLLGEARDFAMAIPGYKALRVVLGEDPITGEEIERNGHNFIEAAFDIMPGGNLLYDKLNELGALTEAEQWIDRKIIAVEGIVHNVISRVETFWNGLSLDDLASPTQIFEDAGNIIHSTISEIVDFAVDTATELLEIVKRWLLTQIVDFIKEHTTAYPLLCVILGEDPIVHTPVLRNGSTILSAILELGGEEGVQQRTQMQETGTFDKAAAWIDRGIGVFSNLLDTITNNFDLIWSVVSIDALMHPIDKFNEIYNTFAQPVADVLQFMADVAVIILQFIKEALMERLSAWAKTQRGYYLVTLIIGKDPFTDKVVPFTMENVIHGFMSLMDGGEEQFAQMKESGAIDRTTAKITAAVEKLNMTPEYIVQLFIDLWNSFSLNDLADPIGAFMRIIDRFGEPIGRLIAFVVEIIKIVIVVILEIMNFPFDLINNIITKAMLAFDLIKKDPIGFLKNLLRAIKEGFMQFFDNILTHLFNGLKAWFLGEVEAAGIPIPTDFTVMGIIKWLLAVLDITMEKIWKKLEDRIGKPKVDKIKKMIDTAQRVASAVGEAYEFMKDVQERGFMAVMIDKVKEQLSNVWEMVLDAVKGFVMDQIIKKVTVKLLSMLDPTGIMAVVNSAIALYKAIQTFIKYLRQMLEIVNSFVEGTLQIAQGQTKKAADFLEGALARGIPIVIGFLANQVGLNLSDRLRDALETVREKVDKGLTWVIDKLVTLVEKLITMGKAAVGAVIDWAKGLLGLEQPFTTTDGVSHRIFFAKAGDSVEFRLNPSPAGKYEDKINEITPAPGAMVNVTTAISVPLKKAGAVLSTINVAAGNTSMAALKGYALQGAKHIDGLIQSNMRTSTDATTQVQDQTPDFSASLVGLSSITSYLLSAGGPNGPLPVTPLPVYGGLVNGFASSMDVKPLTKMGVPGSPVSVSSPLWDDLNLRKHSPGGSFLYIRGHLLNNNVHGSGSTWQNLTPIHRDTNAQHVTAVESKLKEAVDKDLILHYNVTVDYALPRKANLISQIEATPNWDKNSVLNEKHKILEAEANLPLKLNCTIEQIKADGTPLPTSDATYDPKYNISGAAGIVNNQANMSQNTLDEYYLANPTAVTYKDLTTLLTDAGLAIGANAGITWDAFYNNAANKLSIDNLTVAADKETLRNVFRKKDLISEERTRIENQMAMVNWAAFTSGRVAYTGGLLQPADISELHDRFKARMLTSKGFFLSSLTTYVNSNMTDPNTAWGSFRSVQQLNERAYEFPAGNKIVILSEAEIQTFKTTVFDPRINALKAAPAPAPAAAPPVT